MHVRPAILGVITDNSFLWNDPIIEDYSSSSLAVLLFYKLYKNNIKKTVFLTDKFSLFNFLCSILKSLI